jgi:hypothetical protein
MYHKFSFWKDADEFLRANETARLVGWPYGNSGVYTVFIPAPKGD